MENKTVNSIDINSHKFNLTDDYLKFNCKEIFNPHIKN